MADDPRTPPDDDTREKIVTEWTPMNETGRRVFLAELDRVDPLRALLADEDRAIDLIANAIYGVDGNSGPSPLRYAFPVLAALREVADDQSPAGSRGYAAEARRG